MDNWLLLARLYELRALINSLIKEAKEDQREEEKAPQLGGEAGL